MFFNSYFPTAEENVLLPHFHTTKENILQSPLFHSCAEYFAIFPFPLLRRAVENIVEFALFHS
jgi:hypothetical protein